jgi:hypothetical protein
MSDTPRANLCRALGGNADKSPAAKRFHITQAILERNRDAARFKIFFEASGNTSRLPRFHKHYRQIRRRRRRVIKLRVNPGDSGSSRVLDTNSVFPNGVNRFRPGSKHRNPGDA